ncbi:MAG TPA: NAD(P)/FAD-dependent oxidoreductase [Kofleriaceae bacterium]|nr:NAD(P)/FAD-dependent oxidoreductase [Kofleriaceae bacterium]
MARTPFLRSIQQLVRDVRASKATGIPLDEIPEIRKERKARKMSRRGFLAGAAAGGALLTLPGRVRASNKAQPKITIVGGGIAGLTCALTLRDAGFDSTVYEASGRVGGRMFSNTGYFRNGQVSEWGGELIDTGHTTVRRLAKRFNLTLDNLHDAEPTGSDDVYRFRGRYYPKTQANQDFLAMFDAVAADQDAAPFPTTFDSFTPAGKQLDNLSIFDWIESRVPGGHAAPLGQLLDVAYNIEYGAETNVQSSLNLIYLLAFQPTAASDSNPTPSQLDVFGESDETFHIRGGNQLLPEAIAGELCEQVKRGYRLVKLVKRSGGDYVLTFERGYSTYEVISDYVVLAIPFAVLADVDISQAGFDARKKRAIANLGRGHNGKLSMQFDRRGWRGTGPWPGISNGSTFSDTGIQETWDVSRAQGNPDRDPGILVHYSGGNVTDAKKLNVGFARADSPLVVADVMQALPELDKVYPGLRWNGLAAESLPHKSPFFNNSYSYWRVGQYTDFAGSEGLPQGNVHFCGEHTSIDFQGFMEGGATTGKSTAKDLIQILRGK